MNEAETEAANKIDQAETLINQLLDMQAFGGDDHVANALGARLAEARCLMILATGAPYPFNKSLRSVSNALNDTVKAIEHRINRPLEVPLSGTEEDHDNMVTQQVEAREEGNRWLDQARICSTLALMHMSRAIEASAGVTPPLKAV